MLVNQSVRETRKKAAVDARERRVAKAKMARRLHLKVCRSIREGVDLGEKITWLLTSQLPFFASRSIVVLVLLRDARNVAMCMIL
jgi:hypothetical protein